MARVDKTDSAIGVTRAILSADIAPADYGIPVGVSLNASGLVVVGGGGQTAIIGILVPNKYAATQGDPVDIIRHGELVDVVGLSAGTDIYVDATTGALTEVATANVATGFTVEADRLVLTGF